MRNVPVKQPIEVDVITRVSQPMKFGDIFKCADGDIWLARPGPIPLAIALITTADNGLGREEGELFALRPDTIKPPYTLIVSLQDHYDA